MNEIIELIKNFFEINVDAIFVAIIAGIVVAIFIELFISKDNFQKQNNAKNSVLKSNNNTINQASVINVINPLQNKSDIINTVTVTQKTNVYVNTSFRGSFEFDYTNNNGLYIVGDDEYTFTTKWSKASTTAIHAYNNGKDINSIALIKSPVELDALENVEGDFSSRSRTANIGDAIIWRNTNKKYMVTKIINVEYSGRNSENDKLKCEYIITK